MNPACRWILVSVGAVYRSGITTASTVGEGGRSLVVGGARDVEGAALARLRGAADADGSVNANETVF